MQNVDSLRKDIRNFIVSNYLYGQEREIRDTDSFLGEGILDSTGVLELVNFLEETYGIVVADEELVPDNLDSISAVAQYVAEKLGVTETHAQAQTSAGRTA